MWCVTCDMRKDLLQLRILARMSPLHCCVCRTVCSLVPNSHCMLPAGWLPGSCCWPAASCAEFMRACVRTTGAFMRMQLLVGVSALYVALVGQTYLAGVSCTCMCSFGGNCRRSLGSCLAVVTTWSLHSVCRCRGLLLQVKPGELQPGCCMSYAYLRDRSFPLASGHVCCVMVHACGCLRAECAAAAHGSCRGTGHACLVPSVGVGAAPLAQCVWWCVEMNKRVQKWPRNSPSFAVCGRWPDLRVRVCGLGFQGLSCLLPAACRRVCAQIGVAAL
jgi:hypothetical protein